MTRWAVVKSGQSSMCLVCAEPVEQKATGRWALYCSNACRQYAYRRRNHPGVTGDGGGRYGTSAGGSVS